MHSHTRTQMQRVKVQFRVTLITIIVKINTNYAIIDCLVLTIIVFSLLYLSKFVMHAFNVIMVYGKTGLKRLFIFGYKFKILFKIIMV